MRPQSGTPGTARHLTRVSWADNGLRKNLQSIVSAVEYCSLAGLSIRKNEFRDFVPADHVPSIRRFGRGDYVNI